MCTREGETDLALPVGGTGPLQQHLADDRAGLGQLDRQHQPLPGLVQHRLVELDAQRPFGRRSIPHRPGNEADHVSVAVELREIVEIIETMRT